VMWVRRFILFHGKRHPAEMGKREVEAQAPCSGGAQCGRSVPGAGAARAGPIVVRGLALWFRSAGDGVPAPQSGRP
jgi:hypothetical protein